MITEYELLEQIFEEEWSTHRIRRQIDLQGKDLWQILQHHWQDGNIYIKDKDGNILREWQIEQVLREKNPDSDILVGVTDKGFKLIKQDGRV